MTRPEPAIAFLPHGNKIGGKLSAKPLDELSWPLGMPDRLTGKRLCDLESHDHLIVMPNTLTHFRLNFGTRARISMAVAEPSVVHKKHLMLLRLTYRRFFRVLTHNEGLLAAIPNAVFVPFGMTYVPNWRDLEIRKTKMTSLIASNLRDQVGHRLRHTVADWVRDTGQDVDLLGRGYAPFDEKSDGLAPYYYSIVIENCREPNYFSEKLIDAVFCETVPIYWGCPNIDRFIDPDGLILCESEDDIKRAVGRVSVADYNERLAKIRAMKPQLECYSDYDRSAAEAIRDVLNRQTGH